LSPLDFHVSLMGYCYAMRASVTSYGRTAKHNVDVGSVHQDSYHVQWLAADVVYDDDPKPVKALRDKVAGRFGLEVVDEGDHDHLEPKP